jgi:2'-5' RNA ligase
MRCFVAIGIDEPARAAIAGVVGRLRASADAESHRISWARPQGWHVTLKFLGEVAAQKIAAVGEALAAALRGVGRFDLALRGLLGFPRENRARVLAVGVEDRGQCADAARRVEAAVAPLGFASEPESTKEFIAHVTVARLRTVAASRFAVTAVRPYRETPFGTVGVDRVGLYESTIDRSGAEYRLVEDFPLVAR